MKSSRYLFLRKRCVFGIGLFWDTSYMSQHTSFMSQDTCCMSRDTSFMPLDTSFMSWDTFCRSQDPSCMSPDTFCMSHDIFVGHRILFVVDIHTSCMSRDTSCLPWDTFDVTHVATHKHENEIGWLRTKRETPFQLPSQRQNCLFKCSELTVGQWQEKILKKIGRYFYFS